MIINTSTCCIYPNPPLHVIYSIASRNITYRYISHFYSLCYSQFRYLPYNVSNASPYTILTSVSSTFYTPIQYHHYVNSPPPLICSFFISSITYYICATPDSHAHTICIRHNCNFIKLTSFFSYTAKCCHILLVLSYTVSFVI